MEGKNAFEHFADEVMSGRRREFMWGFLQNVCFPANSPEESWSKLTAWADANGLRCLKEQRRRGKDTQLWVRFTPGRSDPAYRR